MPRRSTRPRRRGTQEFDERELRDIGQRVTSAINTAIAAIPAAPVNQLVIVHNSSFIINNATLLTGGTTTTSTLPGTMGIPASGAVGVLVGMEFWCSTGVSYLAWSPSNETPDSYSPYMITSSNHGAAGVLPVKLGPTGAITAKATSGGINAFYAWIVGYWT